MNEALLKAYDWICPRAKTCEQNWFVTLYRVAQVYGGPEEGGWWYDHWFPIKTAEYHERKYAQRVAHEINKRAQAATTEAKKEHDEEMRRSCDWCEERGIEPEDHPAGEPDGPDRYVVVIEETPGSRTTRERPRYE
jgi:hypothetical protein